jgi:hypothetical protein
MKQFFKQQKKQILLCQFMAMYVVINLIINLIN